VTICNTYPLGQMNDSQLSWKRYIGAMNFKKAEWTYENLQQLIPDLKQNTNNHIWSYLFTPGAYFSNLPVISWKERMERDQLIVDCSAYDWDWTVYHDIECDREPVLQTRWDPDYHHCYTIHIPDDRKEARLFFTDYR